MAENADARQDETARLEAALERIARAQLRRPASGAQGTGREALAARLDGLIAELRALLGRDSSD